MADISDWTFSQHALSRAVDMALDPDEIKAALESPTRPLPSKNYEGCHLIHTERLTFAVDLERKLVITVGWNTFDGTRAYRYSRDDDIEFIRDPE